MTRGEYDLSTAFVAFSKAIQAGGKSKSPLGWGKIKRAAYGVFSSVPISTNYHDKELDLATSACDKNFFLLQSPGDRFEKRVAETALWLLKRFGDSADRRKAIGDLARMRNSSDSAGPGREVPLAEASYPWALTYNPTGLVHGTGGDYGNEQGEGYDDGGEYGGGLHGDGRPHTHYADGGDAGQDLPVGPSR